MPYFFQHFFALHHAQKIMGVKKLVSFGWAAGGVVEISCGTIIIVSGSENHEKYMGVKKLLVLGGWWVGWGWGGGNQLWDHHHCVWLKKS